MTEGGQQASALSRCGSDTLNFPCAHNIHALRLLPALPSLTRELLQQQEPTCALGVNVSEYQIDISHAEHRAVVIRALCHAHQL